MRPKQLQQFLSVCQHGSMSAAAYELGVAQPALSKQIGQLEHELQVKLFERHSRGVSLTSAGEKLRTEAAELIRKLESIKMAIRQSEEEIRGEVRLSVIASQATALAVDLYPRIERDYPGIKLDIIDNLSDQAVTALLRQEVDFGILPNVAQEFQSIPLFKENFFLIKRATRGAQSPPISFLEAAAEPLILPLHTHDLRRRLEDCARSLGVQLNVKYESSSINVIDGIVEKGLAASIVPITNWLDSISSGRISASPVVDPSLSRALSLCWMPGRTMSPAAIAVRDLVQVEVRAMISGGKLSGTLITS